MGESKTRFVTFVVPELHHKRLRRLKAEDGVTYSAVLVEGLRRELDRRDRLASPMHGVSLHQSGGASSRSAVDAPSYSSSAGAAHESSLPTEPHAPPPPSKVTGNPFEVAPPAAGAPTSTEVVDAVFGELDEA